MCAKGMSRRAGDSIPYPVQVDAVNSRDTDQGTSCTAPGPSAALALPGSGYGSERPFGLASAEMAGAEECPSASGVSGKAASAGRALAKAR